MSWRKRSACLLNVCHCVRVQSFKRHSHSPRRTNDLTKEKHFQYNIIRTVLNAMLNAIMEICSMSIDAENIKSFWGGKEWHYRGRAWLKSVH